MTTGIALVPYSGEENEPTPGGDGDAAFGSGAVAGNPVLPCDRHDDCYQTCNSVKADCDVAFHRDMSSVCEGVTGTYSATVPDLPGFVRELERRAICRQWSDYYFAAVDTFGGAAFNSGQENQCDCVCPPS